MSTYEVLFGHGLFIITLGLPAVIIYCAIRGYKVWKGGLERFNDGIGETGPRVKTNAGDRVPLRKNIPWLAGLFCLAVFAWFLITQLNSR